MPIRPNIQRFFNNGPDICGIVFTEDYFFADFRIWVLAVKAFEAPILRYAPYILLFVTYYIAVSVATNCFNYNQIGKRIGNVLICGLFNAAPAIMSRAIYRITRNPYIFGITNALIIGVITIINTCTIVP